MNERIEKFARECGAWNLVYGNRTFMIDEHFEIEKFAELIVKECMGIVKPTSHHEAFAQGYMGDVDGLDLLYGKVKQIREHFGVEE